MLSSLTDLIRLAISDTVPARCILCGCRCLDLSLLCEGCLADVHTNVHPCHRCALPHRSAGCADCDNRAATFTGAEAPLLYTGSVRSLISRWKFRNEPRLTALLVDMALDHSRSRVWPVDAIVPLPTHWRRRWHRGFDQTWLLAHALKQATGLPLPIQGVLKRIRHIPPQSHLPAAIRDSNVQQAFIARKNLQQQRLLLIDDVMTTGATVSAASEALLRAGAAEVFVWCLARVDTPPQGV